MSEIDIWYIELMPVVMILISVAIGIFRPRARLQVIEWIFIAMISFLWPFALALGVLLGLGVGAQRIGRFCRTGDYEEGGG